MCKNTLKDLVEEKIQVGTHTRWTSSWPKWSWQLWSKLIDLTIWGRAAHSNMVGWRGWGPCGFCNPPFTLLTKAQLQSISDNDHWLANGRDQCLLIEPETLHGVWWTLFLNALFLYWAVVTFYFSLRPRRYRSLKISPRGAWKQHKPQVPHCSFKCAIDTTNQSLPSSSVCINKSTHEYHPDQKLKGLASGKEAFQLLTESIQDRLRDYDWNNS